MVEEIEAFDDFENRVTVMRFWAKKGEVDPAARKYYLGSLLGLVQAMVICYSAPFKAG